MVSSENYFDKILTESNKLNKQGKEKPEDDDPILTAYLLQLRAANWFANNPGSVLLNSAKYSGCKSSTGSKEPLGGPIDETRQNYRNRQGSTFCSDEYPFWECPNKKKKSVTIVGEKSVKEIEEKSVKEIEEKSKENMAGENFVNNSNNTVAIAIIIGVVFIFLALYYFGLNKLINSNV